LGELKEVNGSMPIPSGMVEVSLSRNGKSGISGEITLPRNTGGRLVWGGKEIKLRGGRQQIDL
jgi:hypothetical protein